MAGHTRWPGSYGRALKLIEPLLTAPASDLTPEYRLNGASLLPIVRAGVNASHEASHGSDWLDSIYDIVYTFEECFVERTRDRVARDRTRKGGRVELRVHQTTFGVRRTLLRILAALGLVSSIAIAGPPGLRGQETWPLQIGVGTDALTVPWYPKPVSYRLNPMAMVGTARALHSGASWKISIGMNLAFVRDYWWMTGLSLEPEFQVARALPGGLEAQVALGLGYMHYFWRREMLTLRDGEYVEAANWGRPSLVIPSSLTLVYRGPQDRPHSVSPFVSARWSAQVLFLSETPLVSHLSLLGGVRIDPGGEGGEQ